MSDLKPSSHLEEIFKDYPGLSSQDVEVKIKTGDVNRVTLRSSRTYQEILKENVFTLFNISLGAVLFLLVILGKGTDAFFAGISVITNIIVGVFQEIRAKLILDRLALLSVQKVTVRRDNQTRLISINEVVRGDFIILQPGDKVAVDGTCIKSDILELDESLLTGESEPVAKQKGDPILSGSFCLAGSGLFQAEKIGQESYAAHITQFSRIYKSTITPLQEKIDLIVGIFLIGLIIASFLHLAASIHLGRSLADTLSLLTVIINSFIPAGLIIAISVSFAVGAVKISSYQSLIQRINAIDSMNSVEILCMDKTGTLTQNKLSVNEIIPLSNTDEATLKNLIALYTNLISTQNTTAHAMAISVGKPNHQQAKIGEIPFNSSLKWGAITLDNHRSIIVGSPEILLTELTAKQRAIELAKQGLRLIAIVTSETINPDLKELPKHRQDRGLITLKDELRPEAKDTIFALQNQHIEVKIISGDSLETVTSIANQAGISTRENNIFCQNDLDYFNEVMFNRAARNGQIFARIKPETKRRLIATLVRHGAYVAMVGDGVNDVAALKEAQLAISMNEGAQITKDVSDIVLLNNSLATLLKAFLAGDIIKQKILVSAKLFLAKNLMVIFTILFVCFVQLPFPIHARQLSILTFPSVTLPTILIALGMFHPRRVNNLMRNVIGSSILAGLIGGLAMTCGYIFTYRINLNFDQINSFSHPTQYWEIARPEAQGIAVIIGLIYTLLIFLDSSHISIWKPHTLSRGILAIIIGLGSVIALTVLLLGLPDLFEVEKPDDLSWFLAISLPFIAHYILRRIQCSPYLRYLRKIFQGKQVRSKVKS